MDKSEINTKELCDYINTFISYCIFKFEMKDDFSLCDLNQEVERIIKLSYPNASRFFISQMENIIGDLQDLYYNLSFLKQEKEVYQFGHYFNENYDEVPANNKKRDMNSVNQNTTIHININFDTIRYDNPTNPYNKPTPYNTNNDGND